MQKLSANGEKEKEFLLLEYKTASIDELLEV